MPQWSSSQYLKFQQERTQPAIDLAVRLRDTDEKQDTNVRHIVDLGCGPGNSTAVLKAIFPNALITGIDSSQNMIASAIQSEPSIHFQCLDIEKDLKQITQKYDIVFSNACIQWIPDHDTLLRNIMELLNPGGRLAIQIPVNYNEPIHQIIGDVVTSEKWIDRFPELRVFHHLTQSQYYDLLADISSDFIMWETTYLHRMKSHESIMEWYKGTGLRPYLEVLSEREQLSFEADVLKEVAKRYPVQANDEVIFRFPRLFFIAVK